MVLSLAFATTYFVLPLTVNLYSNLPIPKSSFFSMGVMMTTLPCFCCINFIFIFLLTFKIKIVRLRFLFGEYGNKLQCLVKRCLCPPEQSNFNLYLLLTVINILEYTETPSFCQFIFKKSCKKTEWVIYVLVCHTVKDTIFVGSIRLRLNILCDYFKIKPTYRVLQFYKVTQYENNKTIQ